LETNTGIDAIEVSSNTTRSHAPSAMSVDMPDMGK